MTLYQDTFYQTIDSPLSDFFEPYDEPDWEENQVVLVDPTQQIQQRMLLIIGVVSVLVILFAVFVLPNIVKTNINSAASQSAVNSSQSDDKQSSVAEGLTAVSAGA